MFFGAFNTDLKTAASPAGHPALTLGAALGPRREGVVQRGRWSGISRAGALALFVPLMPFPAQEPPPEVAVVERIEILNNQYLQRETLLFYISTKPGDPYDVRKLREDFRRLWDTGFLDDLQVEAIDGPAGKVVRFKVTERKRIQIVDFRGSKELSTSTIEEALKKADAQIKIDTFYDPGRHARSRG
jgi:outer membrane protein insertion porin family